MQQNEFNRYVADNQDDLKYWDVMNQAKDEGLNADEAIGYANLRAQIEEEYR
jgi:hypothetical protein